MLFWGVGQKIPLFKMSPSIVLCSVLKCKKALMCLMEKMCVINELCSGIGYSAVGCEFNVSESMVCIQYGVFKEKHT